MKVYQEMIREVQAKGTRKENRTGVDTMSTFGHYYEVAWDPRMATGNTQYLGKSSEGTYKVPLLTTKSVSWKNIVSEMLWFLSGDPTIEILKHHKCKFWDAWADEEGNVPMAYGQQWRRFPVPVEVPGEYGGPPTKELGVNDQIKWVLNEIRRSPMSRRLIVSAWAPALAQTAKLPPCHLLFAFNVQLVEETLGATYHRDVIKLPDIPRESISRKFAAAYHMSPDGQKILREEMACHGIFPKLEQRLCLHLTQRSCDLALGVPYNMASYGLLLLIFSQLTGIKPGIFAHTLVDLHVYTKKPDGSGSEYDHWPGLEEQLTRKPRELPELIIDPSIKELEDIEALMAPEVTTEEILGKFKLEGYDPHPAIRFKVAV